jgi:hypothetical protein
MARISHSSSEPSWRRMKTTRLGGKTFLPRRNEPIPSPPKKIRWQVPSFLAGHRMILPTAAKEPKATTASPATMAGTTTTAAATPTQDLRRVLVVDCSVLIRPSLGAVISSFVFAVSLLIEFSFVLATLLRRNHLSQEPMATHRLQNIPIRI